MRNYKISEYCVYRGTYSASFEELTTEERKLYSTAEYAFRFFVLDPKEGMWRTLQRRICAFQANDSQPDYEIQEKMDFALNTILDVLIPVYEARPNKADEVADFLSGITANNINDISAELRGKDAEYIWQYTSDFIPLYPATTATGDFAPDTAPKIVSIAQIAYDKFQMHWMMSHGFSMNDIYDAVSIWKQNTEDTDEYPFAMFVEEHGFGNGSLWPCFMEFLDAEYLDVPFMKSLLTEEQFREYLQDIGLLHIQKHSGEEAEPAVRYWSNADGELHYHGKYMITKEQLPAALVNAYEDGVCGDNLYLCETEKGYGVALVYEYNVGMAEDRSCSMDELFECAVADAEQMIMAKIDEEVQVFVMEQPNGENYHDLVVVFPADTHVDIIREESGLFDCFAYKARFENGFLMHDNANVDSEKIVVPTPLGTIVAQRVGGRENAGVAVDFHPHNCDDYASAVMEYATTYRPLYLGDEPKLRKIVQTRVHRNANREPSVLMEMRPGK